MPNAVIEKLAKSSGKNPDELERVWKKLAKKFDDNYAEVTSIMEHIYGSDSNKVEDSNRTKNEFGHLIVKDCIITAESVDPYFGKDLGDSDLNLDPDKIYYVYRPLTAIQKAVDSYKNVPLTNEHYFVDQLEAHKDKWLGTTGGICTIKDGKVYNDVIIWANDGVSLVEEIKKNGLSAGYIFKAVEKSGEFNGIHYDLMMDNIVCNHVALVENPRVKVAKLADSNNNFNGDNVMEDILKVFESMLKDNPKLVDILSQKDAMDEFKKGMMDKLKDEDKDKLKDDDKDKKNPEVEDEEEEEEEDKDKKKKEESKVGDALFIKQQIHDAIKEYNFTKSLCEKVLGKTNFATDAEPEHMINATLKAKNVSYDNLSKEAKLALLKYISDNASSNKVEKIYVKDSTGLSDFNIIKI